MIRRWWRCHQRWLMQIVVIDQTCNFVNAAPATNRQYHARCLIVLMIRIDTVCLLEANVLVDLLRKWSCQIWYIFYYVCTEIREKSDFLGKTLRTWKLLKANVLIYYWKGSCLIWKQYSNMSVRCQITLQRSAHSQEVASMSAAERRRYLFENWRKADTFFLFLSLLWSPGSPGRPSSRGSPAPGGGRMRSKSFAWSTVPENYHNWSKIQKDASYSSRRSSPKRLSWHQTGLSGLEQPELESELGWSWQEGGRLDRAGWRRRRWKRWWRWRGSRLGHQRAGDREVPGAHQGQEGLAEEKSEGRETLQAVQSEEALKYSRT